MKAHFRSGERKPKRVEVNSDYTIQADDDIIAVDTTPGVVNLTLPVPKGDGNSVKVYIVVDEGGNAGTNAINVLTPGTETINGAGSHSIVENYDQQGYYANKVNGDYFTI